MQRLWLSLVVFCVSARRQCVGGLLAGNLRGRGKAGRVTTHRQLGLLIMDVESFAVCVLVVARGWLCCAVLTVARDCAVRLSRTRWVFCRGVLGPPPVVGHTCHTFGLFNERHQCRAATPLSRSVCGSV